MARENTPVLWALLLNWDDTGLRATGGRGQPDPAPLISDVLLQGMDALGLCEDSKKLLWAPSGFMEVLFPYLGLGLTVRGQSGPPKA